MSVASPRPSDNPRHLLVSHCREGDASCRVTRGEATNRDTFLPRAADPAGELGGGRSDQRGEGRGIRSGVFGVGDGHRRDRPAAVVADRDADRAEPEGDLAVLGREAARARDVAAPRAARRAAADPGRCGRRRPRHPGTAHAPARGAAPRASPGRSRSGAPEAAPRHRSRARGVEGRAPRRCRRRPGRSSRPGARSRRRGRRARRAAAGRAGRAAAAGRTRRRARTPRCRAPSAARRGGAPRTRAPRARRAGGRRWNAGCRAEPRSCARRSARAGGRGA